MLSEFRGSLFRIGIPVVLDSVAPDRESFQNSNRSFVPSSILLMYV